MLEKAASIKEQLIGWRREFHSHPELGFREEHTSRVVAETLESLGYRVRRGVGRTGVVADIGSGGPTIAFRADMDALPIQEANQVAYASKNPGIMHACGHDAHTAIALGTATLLAREQFTGRVRFLFQPAEEINDAEGFSGAPRMIHDGAMEGVDMVISLHVDPASPVGSIRISSGPASGGVDSWFGKIIGRGGHGARPQDVIDPFNITAHVIIALNAIVSRRLHPFAPAVVSIGAIHGGEAENVIPEEVKFAGTLRYTDQTVRKQIHSEIRNAFELSRTLGGDYELKFDLGTPPMINHPQAVALIESTGKALLGEGNVMEMKKELGAEDFGCFSDLAPGAMFYLGTRIENDERQGHNPHFDIDEAALPVGVELFTEIALRYFSSRG